MPSGLRLAMIVASSAGAAACGGGSEGPGVDSLLVADSTVLLGLDKMAADSIFVLPVCGGSPVIDCPDGVPGDPVPIAATLVSDSVSGGGGLPYHFAATVELHTVTDIPITSAGLDCGLAIDTHPGPGSYVTLTGDASFMRRGADSLFQELFLHVTDVAGIDSADMTITGTILCGGLNLGIGLLGGTLVSILEQGTALCAAPGPALFKACPPESPLPARSRPRGARR